MVGLATVGSEDVGSVTGLLMEGGGVAGLFLVVPVDDVIGLAGADA